MSHWSAENATKAYLKTIRMGKRGKEPDVEEFISALAGGNNAKLMVEVCGSTAGQTTLGLVAAAQQTGGRVVCILPGPKEVHVSKSELAKYSNQVDFVTGDPVILLNTKYKNSDFVTIDCYMNSHKIIFKAVQKGVTQRKGGALVVGYNAQHLVPLYNDLGGHFLPIGEGVLVSKVVSDDRGTGIKGLYGNGVNGKKSKWIVKVDKCTGEEHVFRVTFPHQKVIHA